MTILSQLSSLYLYSVGHSALQVILKGVWTYIFSNIVMYHGINSPRLFADCVELSLIRKRNPLTKGNPFSQ